MSFLSKDVGVDLGTANTLVYMKGKGIIMREPSVVAVDTKTDEVRCVGAEAKAVIGRTPGSIVAVRPLKDGVIADFDITANMLENFLKKFVPALYKALGVYLPLITTNCAVLGVTVLNITENYNFVESMVNSLGAGLGFMLAMVLFAGVRTRLENIDAPKYFQGLPITLLAASLVSASFIGFAGVVDGLFM